MGHDVESYRTVGSLGACRGARRWATGALALLVACAGPATEDAALDTAIDTTPTDAAAGDIAAGDIAAVDTHEKPEETAGQDASPDVHPNDGGCSTVADCPPSADACESPRCLASGKCTVVRDCQCDTDTDCEPYDDANACNGTLFCDRVTLPYRCRFTPGSVVTCPNAGDGPCVAQQCDPATGKCAPKHASEAVPCTDGQACTDGDHCKGGVCVAGAFICDCQATEDCAGLDDADACNGTMYCDKSKPLYKCAPNPATVVHCSAEATACSAQVCDPKTGTCGTVPAPDGAACDDNDACTQGDACKSGLCASGDKNTCSCNTHADCDPLEDGDACNGTLYCDKSVTPHACTINPATKVQCPTTTDTDCTKNACYPKSGACQLTIVEQLVESCSGTGFTKQCGWKLRPPGGAPGAAGACEDGDKCTVGEACNKGNCQGGTDTCGCKVDKDCVQQLDNVCTGKLFCSLATGKCAINPATAVTCKTSGDSDCVKNACIAKTGECKPTWLGKTQQICVAAGGQKACRYEVANLDAEVPGLACSDGDACTSGETCAQGQCTGGVSICTCKTNADCQDESANKCLGTLYCDHTTNKCALNPATKVVCNKAGNSACLTSVCQPKSGDCALQPANDDHLCDDGNACTAGDLCAQGKCKPGTHTCECWLDKDCADKEDGNACNGTLYCDKTGAKPQCALNKASIVVCNKDHGSPCRKDACNPSTGKCAAAATNDGASCDDADKCTTADVCAAGKCGGKARKCDDNSHCTDDTCKSDVGCVFTKHPCDDGNACTADVCDPATGSCDSAPTVGKTVPCDADQSGCTVGDHCENKVCVAGSPISCTLPTKMCERAICTSTGSSTHKCEVAQEQQGTACDDGDACTVGSVCEAGKCSGVDKERFFVKTFAPSAEWSKDVDRGAWQAVAAGVAGDLLLAGGAWTDSGGQAKTRWWIARTDAAGAIKWQQTIVGKAESTAQQAFAAVAGGDGSSYFAGTIATAGGDLNGLLVRMDDAGTATWQAQYGTTTHAETIAAMVGTPTADFTVAGARTQGGLTVGWVQRVAANGATVWSEESGGAGLHTEATALARRDGGGVVVAGWQKDTKTGAVRGLVWDLNAKGEPQWSRLLGWGTPHQLQAVTLRKDGSIVVAGWHGSDTAHQAWLAALGAEGKPSWSDETQQGARLFGVTATDTGRLLTAGSLQPLGGKASMWAAGADKLGNRAWQRTFTNGDAAVGTAVVALGDDGLVIAGNRTQAGKSAGFVARTDPWGHGSCKDAGQCLGKAAASCDDDSDCTADVCDGAKGCQQPNVDQLRCENGDGCTLFGACTAGKCPTAKDGRLFDRPQYVGAYAAPSRVARMPDGGYVWTGQNSTTSGYALVVRTDEYGNELWNDTFRVGGLGWGAGACGLSDGRVVAVSRGFLGAIYGRLRIWDAKGKLQTDTDSFFTFWRPLALVCFDDGTFALGMEYLRYDAHSLHLIKYNAALKGAWASNTVSLGSYMPKSPVDHLYWPGLAWGFGAAASKDGSAWFAGTIQPRSGGKYRGWIGRYEATGKLSWQKPVGAGAPANDYLLDVAAAPGGDAVAGGLRSPYGTGSAAWLIRVDAAGKELWQSLVDKPLPAQIYGLDVGKDGAIVAAGLASVNGQYRMWQLRARPDGATVFTRTYDRFGKLTDALALPGGDILMVGRDETAGESKPTARMIRTDAWGHAGCVEAGACAAKKAADCDDGKACTADSCDAAKGCVHLAIAGCL